MTIQDFTPGHVEGLAALFGRLPESDLTFIKEDVSPVAARRVAGRRGLALGRRRRRRHGERPGGPAPAHRLVRPRRRAPSRGGPGDPGPRHRPGPGAARAGRTRCAPVC